MKMLIETLKALFKRPATEKFPFGPHERQERFRGKIFYEADACIGCRQCEKNCPVDAIKFKAKGVGEGNPVKRINDKLVKKGGLVKKNKKKHTYET